MIGRENTAMTPDAIQTAADILADLRIRAEGRDSQLEDLPAACRPESLDKAYAIQEALRPRLKARGLGAPSGWKIGCTTPVMQSYLKIDHPCAGTLYRATTHREKATLAASDFFQLGLECEIAVRLSADLGADEGDRTRERVAAAVGGVMASVEIVDHRFRDFAAVATPSLVADDFFSAGCVLGAERPPEELGDLAALTGGFRIDGAAPTETGTGAAILGHPLNALAWLAEHVAARGGRLRAGAVVSLGSVVKTIYPTVGTRIEAGFDRLPPVTLEIG